MSKVNCPVCLGSGKSGQSIKLNDGSKKELSCSWCIKGKVSEWEAERLRKMFKIEAEQLSLSLE